MNFLTTRQFKRFILDSDVLIARDYSTILTRYYELNEQSWENVDEFVHSIWKDSGERMNLLMMNYRNHQNMMSGFPVTAFENSQRLVLLDISGIIIADSLDVKQAKSTLPIIGLMVSPYNQKVKK